LLAQVRDTFTVAGRDFGRPIGGRVVDDNHFHVCIGRQLLRERTVNGTTDKRRAVVSGDDRAE
jgi:hypothetical protein